jgi:hypothetical protein
MKIKWKIVIKPLVLMLFFVGLASVSGFLSGYYLLGTDIDAPPIIAGMDTDIDTSSSLSYQPSPNNIDNLLNEMEFAALAFNAPATINIDDSPQIQLILSLSETIDVIKQSIIEEGERIGATIKVSNRMEARLSGYMFQISAITPETQAISKSQRTEWKWEIYPKEVGQHRLHLTLTALLEIDGHSTPRAIRTFNKIINVNVTTAQKFGMFFKNNWQWLWAAILIPVAGWLWKRKK